MKLALNRNPSSAGRSRMSMRRLWLGLFGAPSAWAAQLLLSEPFAAYACYPYQSPLSAPVFAGLPAILATISLVCFAVASLSGFAAWSSWRQFENDRIGRAGEDRNRFLIKLSLMSSSIFFIAVIFNICAVLLVPPCSPWV